MRRSVTLLTAATLLSMAFSVASWSPPSRASSPGVEVETSSIRLCKINGKVERCDLPLVPSPAPTDSPSPQGGLTVSGNEIHDATGNKIHFRGVNIAGAEYACWQGWGVFDGPTDAASISALKSWNVNMVSLSLNEACWLSTHGVKPAFSGATYRNAIVDYVNRLTGEGLYVNLRFSWRTDTFPPMHDREHASEWLASVAETFKSNPRVMFDLHAEPHPDAGRASESAWRCWRDGGMCPNISYEMSGMQELVDAVRSTGAANLLIATSVAYGNNVVRWSEFKPADPLGNLAAGWHIYKINACRTSSCWNEQVAPLAAEVPLIVTEMGAFAQEETAADDAAFVADVLKWLDENGADGSVAWTWNRWASGRQNLIKDWDGTPTIYGRAVKDQYLGS